MAETVLDAETYERILDFALLDPYAPDYYERVLSLFKTNFNASLTAYSVWFHDGRLASCVSIGLSEELMRQAHSTYVNDVIRELAAEKMASNAWDGIFWSQDADPFTYAQSRNIRVLNEHRIHYFAIAVLLKEPRINLMMCKTDREGPFTVREREIIQRLVRLLSRQAQLRITHNTDRNVLEIINSHCLNKKTGLIITDEEGTVLTYNEAALSFVPKNLNPKSINDAADYIFSLFENNEHETDEGEQSITRNGRVYTRETIRLIDEEGKQSEYNLITIRKNRHIDNKVDLSVSASYGLTERETGIAQLLLQGYSNYEIADQLHISVHTVKIHVSNIFRKLQVHTRMEALMKLREKA